MRMCLRCGEEMEEGFALSGGFGNTIRKKGFSMKATYPKAAVCMHCGEVSIYLDDKKIEKFEDKDS